MARPINVIVFPKGDERYVFIYHDDRTSEVLRQLGVWASRSDLSLTLYDEARISHKIREQQHVGHDHR